jgi:hypothetical protein
VVGCGTANLASVRALARSPLAERLDEASLIDPAAIREHNAVTCPEYAGDQGKPKVERLAELARAWFAAATVNTLARDAEDVDWNTLLPPNGAVAAPAGRVVVLIGLDDWESRLHVIESLRHAAAGSKRILPVQVALERDQAQVTVFGNRWEDACPGCGLFSLPRNEPCWLLGADGEPARGDLQREARAAGALVAEIVTDHLAAERTGCSWVGTKTNLHAARPGSGRFARHTRARARMASCYGPHSPATPLRPQQLLSQLNPV